MAFDELKEKEPLIRSMSSGVGLDRARQLMATFDVMPQDVIEAIEYLSADNIELVAHIHVDDALLADVKANYPNLDTEGWACQDVRLGDGFKWVIIHCLGLFRDLLDAELLKRGN